MTNSAEGMMAAKQTNVQFEVYRSVGLSVWFAVITLTTFWVLVEVSAFHTHIVWAVVATMNCFFGFFSALPPKFFTLTEPLPYLLRKLHYVLFSVFSIFKIQIELSAILTL